MRDTEKKIKVDRIGVHSTHCCPKCGCKYGDPQCPVKLELIETVFLCESCEQDKEELLERFENMSFSELSDLESVLQELKERELRKEGRETARF